MKIRQLFNKKGYLVALLSLAVTACSTVKVSTDYDQSADFTALKGFNWLPKSATVEKENTYLNNRIMDVRITKAIDKQLIAQGFSSSTAPDFYVNYSITSEKKTNIRTYDNYSDYGPSWGWGIGYGHRGMSLSARTETRIDEYQQGSLVIDVIDPTSLELIWRGIGSKRLPESTDAAEMDKLVADVVKSILSKFPPKAP
ncbi:putative lipoprotein [Moritella sp. JT01]|nr:putative lipoprotein [Moritella sp. JT01]